MVQDVAREVVYWSLHDHITCTPKADDICRVLCNLQPQCTVSHLCIYVHLLILNGPGSARVYTATVYITYSIPGLWRRDGGAGSVN